MDGDNGLREGTMNPSVRWFGAWPRSGGRMPISSHRDFAEQWFLNSSTSSENLGVDDPQTIAAMLENQRIGTAIPLCFESGNHSMSTPVWEANHQWTCAIVRW